jgi:hypothetical protein
MKKSEIFLIIVAFVLTLILSGCSSMKTMQLDSIQLTNQLQPGMTYTEVESLMGKPKSTQIVGEQLIARWNLQEKWKGYVPYDLVFNAADKTLISWSENQQAYAQKQEQLKFIATELEKSDLASSTSSGAGPSASFENDPELMNFFVGSYYSFSAVGGGQTGGTERKLSLCPDGKYYSNSESGYSGDAGTGGAWGTASQGGGGGTWKITGSKTSATIAMTNASGKTTTYKFESCGNGCYYLGSVKYAYAGKPECR